MKKTIHFGGKPLFLETPPIYPHGKFTGWNFRRKERRPSQNHQRSVFQPSNCPFFLCFLVQIHPRTYEHGKSEGSQLVVFVNFVHAWSIFQILALSGSIR